METFTDEIMRGLLRSSLNTATIDEAGWHDSSDANGSSEADYIDWLTITEPPLRLRRLASFQNQTPTMNES